MSRSPNERLVAATTIKLEEFHILMLAEPEESGQCWSIDQGGYRTRSNTGQRRIADRPARIGLCPADRRAA
jgi:hypothetical protein